MTHAVFLFDFTGLAALPWARDGVQCFCYDKAHPALRVEGNITFVPWDADDADASARIVERHRGKAIFGAAFPPCDDMAVSGAKHFERKLAVDPTCQLAAVARARLGDSVLGAIGAPHVSENPRSILSTLWRSPDVSFDPYEFGGYLPEDDEHPLYPKYIAPRDAYTKYTCFWTGNGFVMPERRPVTPEPGYSRQYKLLGGTSAKTKTIRSASPRGVFEAIRRAQC